MKRLLAVFLLGVVLFGCTQTTNSSTTIGNPTTISTPTPAPSINAEEAAAVQLAIQNANKQVPVLSELSSRLTGIPAQAPQYYDLQSEGQISSLQAANLKKLSELSFSDVSFETELKTIATARLFRKQMTLGRDYVRLKWDATLDNGEEHTLFIKMQTGKYAEMCVWKNQLSAIHEASGQTLQFAGTNGFAVGSTIPLTNGGKVLVKDINSFGITIQIYNNENVPIDYATLSTGQSYEKNGVDLRVDSISDGTVNLSGSSVTASASPTTAADTSGNAQCITPDQSKVDQLWKLTQNNQLLDAFDLLFPNQDIKSFVDAKKDDQPTIYSGRPCSLYHLNLTQKGVDSLNTLGGAAFSSFSGEICVDTGYGFPVFTRLVSNGQIAQESIVSFSDAEPSPSPSATAQPTDNPNAPSILIKQDYDIKYGMPFAELGQSIDRSKCQPEGSINLGLGGCVVFKSGWRAIFYRLGSEGIYSGTYPNEMFNRQLNIDYTFRVPVWVAVYNDKDQFENVFRMRPTCSPGVTFCGPGGGLAVSVDTGLVVNMKLISATVGRSQTTSSIQLVAGDTGTGQFPSVSSGSSGQHGSQGSPTPSTVATSLPIPVSSFDGNVQFGQTIAMTNGLKVQVRDVSYTPEGAAVNVRVVDSAGNILGEKAVSQNTQYKSGLTFAASSIQIQDSQQSSHLTIGFGTEPTPSPAASVVSTTYHVGDVITSGNGVGIRVEDIQPSAEGAKVKLGLYNQDILLVENELKSGQSVSTNGVTVNVDSVNFIIGQTPYVTLSISGLTPTATPTAAPAQIATATPKPAVGLQSCRTPFVVNSYSIQGPYMVSQLGSGQSSVSGNQEARFDLPSDAQNPSIQIDEVGPASCNTVTLNDQVVYSTATDTKNNNPYAANYCAKNLQGNVGYSYGSTNQNVPIQGNRIDLKVDWRTGASGYATNIDGCGPYSGSAGDSPSFYSNCTLYKLGYDTTLPFKQLLFGSQTNGVAYYKAKQCAYRFVWPSSDIGKLQDKVVFSEQYAYGSKSPFDVQYPWPSSCKPAGRVQLKPGDCVSSSVNGQGYAFQFLGDQWYSNPYGASALTFKTTDLAQDEQIYNLPLDSLTSDSWFTLKGSNVHVFSLSKDAQGNEALDAEFIAGTQGPVTSPSPTVAPTATAAPTCQNTAASCGFNGVCGVCASGQFCQNQVCQTAKDTALIVSDSSISTDSQTKQSTLSLNAEEKATDTLIKTYPVSGVSYVPSSQATYEALSLFQNIVATDYYANSPFNPDVVNQLANQGKKIVLLRDAIGYYSSYNGQSSTSTQSNFNVNVIKSDGFLKNYDADGDFDWNLRAEPHVQDGGSSYQVPGGFYGGTWQAIGTSDHCCNAKSLGSMTTSAGGKVAAFGYDPAYLSDEGKVMMDQALRWALQITQAPDAVPASDVALIVRDYNYDGKSQPSLTGPEQSLKTWLESERKTVYLVPQSRRFTEDYSQASLVALTNGTQTQLNGFYNRLTSQTPGLFLGQAAESLDTFGSGQGFSNLISGQGDTLHGKDFLQHYDSAADHNDYLSLNIAGGTSYCRNNMPGWTQISGIPSGQGCGYGGTMFSRQSGNVRSALIAQDPSSFNPEGWVVADEALRWMLANNAPGLVVPAGNVGLLINDFSNPLALTPNESALKNHLQGIGYKVTIVPQSDRFKTDFSQAAFLAAIEDGIYNKYSFSTSLGALGSYAPRTVFIGPAIGLASDGRQSAESTVIGNGPNYNNARLDFGYNGQLGHDDITDIGPATTSIYTKSGWHFGGMWKGIAQEDTCCNQYTVWTAQPSAHSAGLLFGYTFSQLNGDGSRYLDARMAEIAAKR